MDMSTLPAEDQNEVAGLLLSASAAFHRIGSILPPDTHADFLEDAFKGNYNPTRSIEIGHKHLLGWNLPLAEIFAEAARESREYDLYATQDSTDAQQPSDDLPALIVPDADWQACMAEIQDIITRPYRDAAELGYNPMNSISLAIVKHLNAMPSEPESCLSEAA